MSTKLVSHTEMTTKQKRNPLAGQISDPQDFACNPARKKFFEENFQYEL